MKAAEKLRHLDKEALRLHLKGEKKHEFLCVGLGWVPRTSPKGISRLRAEFKNRRAVEKAKQVSPGAAQFCRETLLSLAPASRD
jgi:hypothetical protein